MLTSWAVKPPTSLGYADAPSTTHSLRRQHTEVLVCRDDPLPIPTRGTSRPVLGRCPRSRNACLSSARYAHTRDSTLLGNSAHPLRCPALPRSSTSKVASGLEARPSGVAISRICGCTARGVGGSAHHPPPPGPGPRRGGLGGPDGGSRGGLRRGSRGPGPGGAPGAPARPGRGAPRRGRPGPPRGAPGAPRGSKSGAPRGGLRRGSGRPETGRKRPFLPISHYVLSLRRGSWWGACRGALGGPLRPPRPAPPQDPPPRPQT